MHLFALRALYSLKQRRYGRTAAEPPSKVPGECWKASKEEEEADGDEQEAAASYSQAHCSSAAVNFWASA